MNISEYRKYYKERQVSLSQIAFEQGNLSDMKNILETGFNVQRINGVSLCYEWPLTCILKTFLLF